MTNIKSYFEMSDRECDVYILDIFHHLPASINDTRPPSMVLYIKSISICILEEIDDF